MYIFLSFSSSLPPFTYIKSLFLSVFHTAIISNATMHIPNLFPVVAFLTFHALSTPITQLTTRQSSSFTPLVEALPWYLTNIRVFEPADSTTQASASILFDIADKNAGLELSSSCQYFTAWGVPSPVTPGGGYVQCLNQDVQFKYDGQRIFVERGWLVPDNYRFDWNASFWADD
jgi:hypothetical protein